MEITFETILRVLRKSFLYIVLFAFAAAVISFVVFGYFVPPTYVAKTEINLIGRRRKLYRRSIEILAFDTVKNVITHRISLANDNSQPYRMFCHRNILGHFQPPWSIIQFNVITAYYRAVWRFHHILCICQRKHTNASERRHHRILMLYRHQCCRRVAISGFFLLDFQVSTQAQIDA